MPQREFKFKTELYFSRGWVCLDVPQKVSDALGVRGRVAVEGKINGFGFRTSIFPSGKGGHFMLVNKAMQSGSKAGDGDKVAVTMRQDTHQRTVEVPADLSKALGRSKKAKAVFEGYSFSHKRELIGWIEDAKRPETRKKRIQKALRHLQGLP